MSVIYAALDYTYRINFTRTRERNMTGEEFKSALEELGWKQATIARRTGANRVTVSRWITENVVPQWAAEYLRVLVLTKRLLDTFETDPRAHLVRDTREALLTDPKQHHEQDN